MTPRASRVMTAVCLLVIAGATPPARVAAQAMAPTSLPQTPAGRTLKEFLESFNAGDSAAMDAFITRYRGAMKVQGLMQLRNTTGGIDLVSVITSEPLHIDVVAREKKTQSMARMVVNVSDGDPVAITAFGFRLVPPGAPPEGCKSYQPPPTASTGAADPKDVASEDAILAALYASISGPACQHRDWDRFRSLFVPGARLIPTGVNGATGKAMARVETPDEYAAAAKIGLEENGFFEHEIARTGQTFGSISHAFSTYESRRMAADEKPFARGINSIQLLNDGTRWWIVTVYWQGERPNSPIPPRYLKNP
jgi:hypothetical protein